MRRRTLAAGIAAVAIAGGVAVLAATPAQATAETCHTQTLVSNGARAYCESFTNGTQIRIHLVCYNASTDTWRDVYGPWRGLPGAYSDAYCGTAGTRESYNIQYH
jgi:hypothetical protein